MRSRDFLRGFVLTVFAEKSEMRNENFGEMRFLHRGLIVHASSARMKEEFAGKWTCMAPGARNSLEIKRVKIRTVITPRNPFLFWARLDEDNSFHSRPYFPTAPGRRDSMMTLCFSRDHL